MKCFTKGTVKHEKGFGGFNILDVATGSPRSGSTQLAGGHLDLLINDFFNLIQNPSDERHMECLLRYKRKLARGALWNGKVYVFWHDVYRY